jgi:hypothetical protein
MYNKYKKMYKMNKKLEEECYVFFIIYANSNDSMFFYSAS